MEMYMVYNDEDGLVYIGNDREEAEKEYADAIERIKDYLSSNGEYSGDEQVILSVVKKHCYSYDTGKPIESFNEHDNVNETYWDLKEDLAS